MALFIFIDEEYELYVTMSNKSPKRNNNSIEKKTV